jgi:hypothetical protein
VGHFEPNWWGETTGEPILAANPIGPGSRGSVFAEASTGQALAPPKQPTTGFGVELTKQGEPVLLSEAA